MSDTGNPNLDQLLEQVKALIPESQVKFVLRDKLAGLLEDGSISGPVDTRDFTKIYKKTGVSHLDNQALGFKAGREAREDAGAYATEHGYDVACRQEEVDISSNDMSMIVSTGYEFYVSNEKLH